MKNIFEAPVKEEIVNRINKLTATTPPQWGKMSVGQMLAHCNVTYEMAFEDIHKKPNVFMRFILKLLVKQAVVGPKPYKNNSQTAPQFVVREDKDFEKEKQRLLNYIDKTYELGEGYFEGRESLSFGKLTKEEWNNMFYKHLDHHLKQFGV